VTGYYRFYKPRRTSRGHLKQTPPHRAHHEDGIETTVRTRYDIIVGGRSQRHRPSPPRVRGRGEWRWSALADGPKTFLGIRRPDFPNFFFPRRAARSGGQQPRYNGDRWTSSPPRWCTCGEHGYDTIEVAPAAEARWTDMVDAGAAASPSGVQLLLREQTSPQAATVSPELRGRPKLLKEIRRVYETGLRAFRLSRLPDPAVVTA